MDYNLVKQLKDAGFPIKKGIICANCKIYIVMNGVSTDKYGICPICECDSLKELFYGAIPTLSELIEVCGDKFYCLRRQIDKFPSPSVIVFIASSIMRVEQNFIQSKGSTPEEAVAKLWIELNKK